MYTIQGLFRTHSAVCPALGARRLLLELPEATSTITGAAGDGLGLEPMTFRSGEALLPALRLSLG